MTKLMISAVLGAAMLSACGGGGSADDKSPCAKATITVAFETDETTLERGPRDEVLEMIAAHKAACPIAHVTIYRDASGEETATRRSNHISNLLTARADMQAESKVRAVEDAPSDKLAGKALIRLATEK